MGRDLSKSVEHQRQDKGAKKQSGHTRIEVNPFVGEDQDHPQMIGICTELKRL
jgi:hypothetical protein